MIPYNILRQIEGDTDKHSNYFLRNYDTPNTKDSDLARRDKEARRIQLSFSAYGKRLLLK